MRRPGKSQANTLFGGDGRFDKGALVQREALSKLSQLYIQEGMVMQASNSVYGLDGSSDKIDGLTGAVLLPDGEASSRAK
jgi:hypothetical protein